MPHLLAATELTHARLHRLCQRAHAYADALRAKTPLKEANGKILGTLFHEPSTRTRLSFETAMLRLGGQVISEANPAGSSAVKGERLADTVRMMGAYADVLAVRQGSHEALLKAASVCPCPIINAGSGAAEHPSQSLIDLYTINERFNLFSAQATKTTITVAFVGDLKYGRTVHSLSAVLRHFPQVQQVFVSPNALKMPEKYTQPVDIQQVELTDAMLAKADVVYATRVQKERFSDQAAYENVKSAYVFTANVVRKMRDNAMLLHPLPRITEVLPEVDPLPQAHYFQQAANGVPVRMALLAEALEL